MTGDTDGAIVRQEIAYAIDACRRAERATSDVEMANTLRQAASAIAQALAMLAAGMETDPLGNTKRLPVGGKSRRP